jgi:hypothetical protein
MKVLTSAVLAGLLIVFGLTWWNAYSSYWEGEKHFRNKDYAMAVLAFEQTILNHFPQSPYQKRAVTSLFIIGDLAHKQNNVSVALQAYQAVLFAKNSLTVYRSESDQDIHHSIEKLKDINPDWVAATIPQKYPNRFWGFCLGIFLLSWIFSILGFLQKGIDQEGKITTPAAYRFGGIFVFTFAFWIFSLINL